MMFFQSMLLYLSLMLASGLSEDLPIVMFRLQNVQSYWCTNMVKLVADEFLSKNTPLTLGLVGHAYVAGTSTYSLREDTSLSAYLKLIAPSKYIEMASHSFQYVPFAGKTVDVIETDLSSSKIENEVVTGKTPTTLIPPQDSYDLATLVAMDRTDMNVISGDCPWSGTLGVDYYCAVGGRVAAPDVKHPATDIFMLPAGAVLGNYPEYWSDVYQPANLTAAIEGIERQIANQGFSVVRMTPYEFGTTSTCETLNTAKLDVLRALIQHGTGRWRFKLFNEGKHLISEQAPTSAPSDADELFIAKNEQCGGVDYTGITECRSGLVCVRESNWFSACRRVRPTRAPVLNAPTTPPEPSRSPSTVPTGQPSLSSSPTKGPQTMAPSSEVTTVTVWRNISGFMYGNITIDYAGLVTIEDNLTECQSACTDKNGCDFVVYYALTKKCHIKSTDKEAYSGMQFREQTKGYLFGFLFEHANETVMLNDTFATTRASCLELCQDRIDCHYVTFDTRATSNVACKLMAFRAVSPMTFIAYREEYRELNAFPAKLGRFDVIGNSGIVAISATLMPDSRILMTARPEYWRGGPNTDNVSPDPLRALQVPYGEIASIFDPITALHKPSEIDDNIFCHGAVLAEDGRMFTAGGDDGGGMNRDASVGLGNGLRNVRYFDYRTDEWTLLPVKLQATRWYPTVVRTTSGGYWIMGGLKDGTNYVAETTMEFYNPGDAVTTLFQNNRVLVANIAASYPYATIIPQTGHIYFFALQNFQVFDSLSGAELDREEWNPAQTNAVHGLRTGDFPGGMTLLPMREDPVTKYVKAEVITFGGVETFLNRTGLRDAARMTITDPIGAKNWTYEEELMPYGRLTMDSVICPNGKILIINGGRNGVTGGNVGEPVMKGSANDIFVYDSEAPVGQRYSVLERSPFQRFYHSTAILVPDGRVLIMGTDQMSFKYEMPKPGVYNHNVEAFTPPWLLDGTPRPVFVEYPTLITYTNTFTITYTGNVDRLSLMTPQSNTHAAEMTQRLFYPTILSQTDSVITFRAPDNPTVMVPGYVLLYIVNGDTPSLGKWIQLGWA